MARAWYRCGVAALILASLGGCGWFREPPGISYAKSVEQLGIYPVYPPREDIQVGDIYAVETHSVKNRLKAKTAYIDTVDMSREIASFLGRRYKFGNTSSGTGPITDTVALSNQTDAFGSLPIPARNDLMSLPIASFPEIQVDSGITIGGQGGGLGAIFGFTASKTLQMTLQFGLVTSYAVPIPVGVDRLDRYCKLDQPAFCTNRYLTYYLGQKYQLTEEDPGHVTSANPIMVTKVYLARQITFTFNDTVLAAAAASATGKSGTGSVPTINGTAVQTAIDNDNPEVLTALAELQKALNEAAARKGAEAGAISIAGISRNGVSFNEVFQRPVVVGYEAVSVLAR